jgi:hypothetical protein
MIKHSVMLSALIFVLMSLSAANGDPWLKTLDTDFTLTQNAYSDSWKGGEAGNISWVWNANGIFERKYSSRFTFKNTSKLSFGQTHIQDKTTKNWQKPQKSTDLIDIENLGLFTLNSYVDPFVGLRFESQFLDASVPVKYRYFSPAKITESAGIARWFYKKEKDELLSRLGFAVRQIITQEITDTTSRATETETTNDGGIESVTDLNLTLSETLHFTSKFSLYKALFYSKADEVKGTPYEDYWKAIDASWENKLSASVAKYVTVSLYMQLLYDKQIDLRGRFKQTLALGLTYKLF